MFVRKKPNKSGIISVQIIDKSSGRYQVVKTIGSSSDPETVNTLVREGKRWIESKKGQVDIFSEYDKMREEEEVVKHLLTS